MTTVPNIDPKESNLDWELKRVTGVAKAGRLVTGLEASVKHAQLSATIWTITATAIDVAIAGGGLVLAVREQLSIPPESVAITMISSMMVILKACEVGGSIRQKATRASAMRTAYSAALNRAQDSVTILEAIARDGITEEERAAWTRTIQGVQTIVELQTILSSSSTLKENELKAVIEDMNDVQHVFSKTS